MSVFNAAQTEQLLKPISGQRVLKDPKGHSHVSQQDVTAHLIRVFGFGAFDTEVLDVQCVFAEPTKSIGKGKSAPDPNRYDVCYRALLRLTIRDERGQRVCSFEDGSTATAQNQTLGDGHDLAYKSAISLAKKRAAINLGDQFGLSLYNKGQASALVIDTLVKPEGGKAEQSPADLQEAVPQQVSLGNDEIDPGEDAPLDEGAPPEVDVDIQSYQAMVAASSTVAELTAVGSQIATLPMSKVSRMSLRAEFTQRMKELKGASA